VMMLDGRRFHTQKGHVVGHAAGGEVIVQIGNGDQWYHSYDRQGISWAKGWDGPETLLAAFYLDASARSLA
jgi:hypothetical protein